MHCSRPSYGKLVLHFLSRADFLIKFTCIDIYRRVMILLALAAWSSSAFASADPSRPNVVFMFPD